MHTATDYRLQIALLVYWTKQQGIPSASYAASRVSSSCSCKCYDDDDDDDDHNGRLNENSPEGGPQQTEIQYHPAREIHLAISTHQVC
jgi:hypothetical protein